MANLINHFVSGTLYLTDRTALLFFPLLILLALFFADGINYKRFKVPSVVLTMIVCMFSLINFGMNANFRKTIVWTFDAHTEKILNKINQEGISTNKIMSIDFSWPLESSINYYTTKNKYSNLIVCKDGYNRETINFSADYYIYFDRSLDKVGYFSDKQLIRDLKKDTAWYYKSDDTYVFSRIAINAGVYK